MPVLALILFIVAATLFGAHAYLVKSLEALGLCVFVVGFICLYLVHSGIVT